MAENHGLAEGQSIKVNGVSRVLAEPITISELLMEINMANRRLAVEVDGKIVPRSAYGDTQLFTGAEVEIITAVGGG